MSKSEMGSVNGDETSPWEAQGSSAQEEKIFVSVRLRPLNERELAKNDVSDWECINNNTILYKNILHERSMFPTALTFDRVFGSECSTRQVYEEAAKKIAFSVVSGINSSIFAYGQTSSGKTYTMSGITNYTIADIYDYINKHRDREFVLKFSAIEIYNECVRDLLSLDSTPLRLLDDPEKGTVVEKLSEVILRDYDHLKELLSVCEAQRQIGETALNEMSSRSHQILRLSVESSVRKYLGSQNSSTLAATVDFVDLAGSERASQTSAAGTRLKEGSHINRSLLTLGTVIRKLSKGRNGHIPYRDSKLTRILQNSLGGNARTAIICTVSPAHGHVEQSRNTLLFASCAKQVSTNAQVNVMMSEKALVKQLQKELARLENELRTLTSLSGSGDSSSALKEKELLLEKKDKEIRELTRQRDMAQSRLQDLIQSDGEYRRARSWAEFSESPEKGAWLDEYSPSEASEIVDPRRSDSTSNVSRLSDRYEVLHSSKSDLQFPENEEQFLSDDTSPTTFIDKYFGPDPCQGWEKMAAQATDQHIEDFCKEVPCIDIDVDKSTTSLDMLSSQQNEPHNPGPVSADDDNESLKQTAQDLKETTDSPIDTHLIEESPISSDTDISDSRSTDKSLSPGSEMAKDNGNIQPSGFQEEIPGKLEELKVSELDHADKKPIPGKLEELKVSELDHADKKPDEKEEKTKISIEESTGSQHARDTELHEDDKPKSQNQYGDDQVLEMEPNSKELEEFSESGLKSQQSPLKKFSEDGPKLVDDAQQSPSKKSSNDGLELVEDPQRSSSNWSMEFERQRREIIELWDACNITLVHRTYFFLLFRGEPSDSIYMEVELRRLSYLKTTFSQGCSVVKNNKVLTKASSIRALNREREMLSKQMLKKFSSKEREALYLKWGIGLKTKQRRLQLCRRLWADTKDMEHIKESAALVANLVGMVEPSRAPKEIFGLSLPQPTSTKSSGWSLPFLHELGF